MYYVQHWNGVRATARRQPVAKSAALMLCAQFRAMGMHAEITDRHGRIIPPAELEASRPDAQFE